MIHALASFIASFPSGEVYKLSLGGNWTCRSGGGKLFQGASTWGFYAASVIQVWFSSVCPMGMQLPTTPVLVVGFCFCFKKDIPLLPNHNSGRSLMECFCVMFLSVTTSTPLVNFPCSGHAYRNFFFKNCAGSTQQQVLWTLRYHVSHWAKLAYAILIWRWEVTSMPIYFLFKRS